MVGLCQRGGLRRRGCSGGCGGLENVLRSLEVETDVSNVARGSVGTQETVPRPPMIRTAGLFAGFASVADAEAALSASEVVAIAGCVLRVQE